MKKPISFVVLFSFLFTTIASSYAQASWWQQRHNSLQNANTSSDFLQTSLPTTLQFPHHPYLTLPANLGTVVDCLAQSSAKPLIIHIQDAHKNYGAQKNTAEILRWIALQKEFNAPSNLLPVYVEGLVSPHSLDWLRAFSQKQILLNTAELLLKQGLIYAEEYLALTAEKNLVAIEGIENQDLYHTNINTRFVLEKARPQILSAAQTVIEKIQQKEKKCSLKLQKIFSASANFDAEKIALKDYLALLVQDKKTMSRYVQTNLFLQTMQKEKYFSADKIQQLLRRVSLVLTQKLDAKNLQYLSQQSLQYRIGRLDAVRYFCLLETLMDKQGVYDTDLKDYVLYLQQVQSIKTESLYREIQDLEKLSCAQEITSLKDRRQILMLYHATRLARLEKKFWGEQFTPQNWRDYQNLKAAWQAESGQKYQGLKTLSVVAGMHNFTALQVEENLRFAQESYYEMAFLRDGVMAKNVCKKIEQVSSNQPAVVLIAGGFHSQGLLRKIKESGYSYVVIRPALKALEPQRSVVSANLSMDKIQKDFAQNLKKLQKNRPDLKEKISSVLNIITSLKLVKEQNHGKQKDLIFKTDNKQFVLHLNLSAQSNWNKPLQFKNQMLRASSVLSTDPTLVLMLLTAGKYPAASFTVSSQQAASLLSPWYDHMQLSDRKKWHLNTWFAAVWETAIFMLVWGIVLYFFNHYEHSIPSYAKILVFIFSIAVVGMIFIASHYMFNTKSKKFFVFIVMVINIVGMVIIILTPLIYSLVVFFVVALLHFVINYKVFGKQQSVALPQPNALPQPDALPQPVVLPQVNPLVERLSDPVAPFDEHQDGEEEAPDADVVVRPTVRLSDRQSLNLFPMEDSDDDMSPPDYSSQGAAASASASAAVDDDPLDFPPEYEGELLPGYPGDSVMPDYAELSRIDALIAQVPPSALCVWFSGQPVQINLGIPGDTVLQEEFPFPMPPMPLSNLPELVEMLTFLFYTECNDALRHNQQPSRSVHIQAIKRLLCYIRRLNDTQLSERGIAPHRILEINALIRLPAIISRNDLLVFKIIAEHQMRLKTQDNAPLYLDESNMLKFRANYFVKCKPVTFEYKCGQFLNSYLRQYRNSIRVRPPARRLSARLSSVASILEPFYDLLNISLRVKWHLNTWFAAVWETALFFILPLLAVGLWKVNWALFPFATVVVFPLMHFLVAGIFNQKRSITYGLMLVLGSTVFSIPLLLGWFLGQIFPQYFEVLISLGALFAVIIHAFWNIKMLSLKYSSVDQEQKMLQGQALKEQVAKMRLKYADQMQKTQRVIVLDQRNAGAQVLAVHRMLAQQIKQSGQNVQLVLLGADQVQEKLEGVVVFHVADVNALEILVKKNVDSLVLLYTPNPNDFKDPLISVVDLSALLQGLANNAALKIRGAAALLCFDMLAGSDQNYQINLEGDLILPAHADEKITDTFARLKAVTDVILKSQ